ncbi:hypothetical protein K461DRAFT_277428 [Myriangium duriaei CBS 260.36]|uniref:Uncharacterized protein n=1 Tax=Myriangium duriaei CBS 260.36 TaxID=1168546 RepID=A0A9P4J8L0_9PEZI|nr:hypothetical protein K461DRAFT_277428 [Myriangium duriaei CBS 260.36]
MEHLFECMDSVKEWHEKSRDIVDYVTKGSTDLVPLEQSSHKRSSSTGTITADTSPLSPIHKLAVIILRSYILTATNKFASWIPPTNEHNGKSHWEWTACMWRGQVAPDLLIYVMNVKPDDPADRTGVDVLDNGKLMVVKRCKGDAASEPGYDCVQGPALRRLGFEVGEFLRAQGC